MLAYFYNCTEKETRVDAVFVASGLASDAQTTKVYSAGERMIYRNATINRSQHYNTTTGEYTCPVNGVYLFTFSIGGNNENKEYRASASLYKEGTEVSSVFFYNENSETVYDTMSRSDIVSCVKGERVWIQSDYGLNQITGNSVYTIFSGVLLFTN